MRTKGGAARVEQERERGTHACTHTRTKLNARPRTPAHVPHPPSHARMAGRKLRKVLPVGLAALLPEKAA